MAQRPDEVHLILMNMVFILWKMNDVGLHDNAQSAWNTLRLQKTIHWYHQNRDVYTSDVAYTRAHNTTDIQVCLPHICSIHEHVHDGLYTISFHWRIHRGGCGGCNPTPLIFKKKRGVTSVAVVISTVSTVSEQERNGQGRRDVGKSVRVHQVIMQLDAYHVRRGFLQKTANKVVYNDGKRLLFAYPFLDVAALMDILYISRSSAIRPTLHSQVHHKLHKLTTSFSQYLWSSSVSLALHFSF